MFEISKGCYNIRKGILFYVYHVFLDAEREFLEQTNIMIKFLDSIVEDMKEITSAENVPDIDIRNHKANYTLKSIMDDYFVHAILPCIDGLLERNEILDYSKNNKGSLV